MTILKYQKLHPASLAGHVDTLRTLTAIFRRANIEVEYAKGFNPHMEIFMSPPLSLGVQSLCEYVCIKADYAEDMLAKLNAVCPRGLTFTKIFDSALVKLACLVDSASFEICFEGVARFLPEIVSKDFCLTTETKTGDSVTKNVCDKIFNAQVITDDKILLQVAIGNNNLRCDKVVNEVQMRHNLDIDYQITKTQAFIGQIPVDSYLAELTKN